MNMSIIRSIGFALLLLVTACARADSDIVISNAWARASAPGQQVAAAYMSLQSKRDATLVKAESNVAGTVEIHSMTMENDVMKMRMMDELPLPAGKAVHLEPGGLHLMLFDLKQSLQAGDKAEFTLHFKYADGTSNQVRIVAPIRNRADHAH
ncbi:hypothetical protein MTYP_01376 [Methylophilaceae bacterium]|nr:hypothetical protein MTYP_01376 [Methylophilaceae bacterium]